MNAGMLPAKKGTCPACAVDHPAELPHDATSMFYQMRFHGTHGRWPTWADAAAHCTEHVREKWKAVMSARAIEFTGPPAGIEPIAERGQDIPKGVIPMPSMEPQVFPIEE